MTRLIPFVSDQQVSGVSPTWLLLLIARVFLKHMPSSPSDDRRAVRGPVHRTSLQTQGGMRVGRRAQP